MDQTIIDLYDRFNHGGMSRVDFLDRLSELAGSRTTAAALLSQLRNDYAPGAMVSEEDPRLVSKRVSYDSVAGTVNGCLVRPKAKGWSVAPHPTRTPRASCTQRSTKTMRLPRWCPRSRS